MYFNIIALESNSPFSLFSSLSSAFQHLVVHFGFLGQHHQLDQRRLFGFQLVHTSTCSLWQSLSLSSTHTLSYTHTHTWCTGDWSKYTHLDLVSQADMTYTLKCMYCLFFLRMLVFAFCWVQFTDVILLMGDFWGKQYVSDPQYNKLKNERGISVKQYLSNYKTLVLFTLHLIIIKIFCTCARA